MCRRLGQHRQSKAARDAVIEIAGDRPLEDLVALRQVRRKRDYARNGTVVELSVDDVEVLVGADIAERFAELELELREGAEADLEPLADLLGEIEELVAVDSSKLDSRAPARTFAIEELAYLVTELDPQDVRLDPYRDRCELL